MEQEQTNSTKTVYEKNKKFVYKIRNQDGDSHIEFTIPDVVPTEPGWNIIGNLEFEGFDLIGDEHFNVLAYKMGKQGTHMWGIGWEHPDPDRREKSPGFGFTDGFIFHSAKYYPVPYVIGPLFGLYQNVEGKYCADVRVWAKPPRFRFRGSKTWITLSSDKEASAMVDKLERRTEYGPMVYMFDIALKPENMTWAEYIELVRATNPFSIGVKKIYL